MGEEEHDVTGSPMNSSLGTPSTTPVGGTSTGGTTGTFPLYTEVMVVVIVAEKGWCHSEYIQAIESMERSDIVTELEAALGIEVAVIVDQV